MARVTLGRKRQRQEGGDSTKQSLPSFLSCSFNHGLPRRAAAILLSALTVSSFSSSSFHDVHAATSSPSPASSSSLYANATAYWIDPETPSSVKTIKASTGQKMVLVASDEFNKNGRTFKTGEDKMWTALDTPDVTNQAIDYIGEDMATTEGGSLRLALVKEKRGGREFVGSSIQSWNKFCFTGGRVEARAQWPAATGTWPGIWMMGNLGRPQYEDSNLGVWPFSYNVCDKAGSKPTGQRITACDPNPGPGLHPNQGRGAPEIDILEAWADDTKFFFPSSLQVAPSLPLSFKPYDGEMPSQPYGGPQNFSWYGEGVTYGNEVNTWYGHNEKGYWSNAVANLRRLKKEERDAFNVYAVEWKQGEKDGYLKFFFNGELLLSLSSAALKGKCDSYGECVGDRDIPNEPMAFVFTMALAPSWAGGEKGLSALPAYFLVDYIRWYQDPARVNIGCDPADYPTREYIEANPKMYGPPALPSPPLFASFHYNFTSLSRPGLSPAASSSTAAVSDGNGKASNTTTGGAEGEGDKKKGNFLTRMPMAGQVGLLVGGSIFLSGILAGVLFYISKRQKEKEGEWAQYTESGRYTVL